jgi:4'-phosphopantetheinyl transferase
MQPMTFKTHQNESPWQAAPRHYSLSADAIHVWRIRLDQSAAFVADCHALLTVDERVHAAQLADDHLQQRWIVGRGVMRQALGRYLDYDPACLRFGYGAYGKPYLYNADQHGCRFNLTHSHTTALLAIASYREVGIDLEAVRSIANVEQIIDDICTPREQALLRSLPVEQQHTALLRCWTRKEALVKAWGRALDDNLRQLDTIEDQTTLPIIAGDNGGVWSIRSLIPAQGYVGAVVARGTYWQIQQWDWST